MAEITYLDFDLLIEGSGTHYRARVLNSPAGQAACEFALPFSEIELENFLLRVGRTRRGVRRLESPEMEAARAFGGSLFEAVFGDRVQRCLRNSLDEAGRHGVGLRMRLCLGDVPELADLPWEYLYDPTLDRFLVLSVETPLVRYLDLPQGIRPLQVEPPLKVLVMISSPEGYPILDVEREWAKLREALSGLERRELVALERLDGATLANLQRRLRRDEYHIFHFIGHGVFDTRAQDGVLLLEGQGGQGRQVSGRYLGTLLHDHRSLGLAILNACEGARSSRSDPFAGTAQSLVRQGVPAVIAMQFEITDEAAITLAHEFYAALADGYSVDAALAEARKAIFAQGNDVEWGTPVLYMRLPDGHIFDVAAAPPTEMPGPVSLPPTDEELEQRLEQLYTDGLTAFWLEEWDKACHSFQSIVDVRPAYQDAAAKLEDAKRQGRLSALYDQAQAALEQEAWQEALSALRELTAEDAGYRDAASLLEKAQRHKQLADLYAQAQRLYQAQRWQAVINVFAEIHAIAPEHADAEGLLPIAQREAAELERQERLNKLHSQAVRAMDHGLWEEAQLLFTQIQEEEPNYPGTGQLLAKVATEIAREKAERERQEQVATLYERAQALAQARQWRQALAAMQEIRLLNGDLSDPQGIEASAQEEVSREEELQVLYGQAQTALEEDAWAEAVTVLEALVDQDAAYRDAATLLATAKRRKRLADLYHEAQALCETQHWQDAIEVLNQIHAIDPAYGDSEELLVLAERQAAEAQHRAELGDLYVQATGAMDKGQWDRARQLLTQVQAREPGYRETEQLLAQAETEINREKAESERQERVSTLYEQAQGLADAGQWRQAMAVMDEIRSLDAGFVDPQEIAKRAREKVDQEESEGQRQRELAALYAEAVRLLQAEQYQEALEKWGDVQERDPQYRDRKRVQATARRKLAALARRPRAPRWRSLRDLRAIGLAVLGVLTLGGVGYGLRSAVVSSLETARATQTIEAARATRTVQARIQATGTARAFATNVAAMTRIARTPTLTGATNPELPSPVLSVLSDVEVLDQDEFDRLEPDRWDRSNELIRAADGMAEIQGTADWATLLRRTEDLGEGEAVLVLFTYDEDAPGEFFLSLSSGDWESDDYRRWAIGIDEPNGIFATDVYLGTNYSSEPLAGHLSASPDTWYYALLAVDRGGEFIAMVWERDNPSEKAAAWRDMGPAWSGLPWEFIGQANRGVVYVDALTGISFGEIQRPALPSHLLNVLFLAEAGYDDDLDRLPSSGWLHEGQIRAANGLLEMTALAGSTTLLQRAPWAREGEGMLLLLKYDSDAEFAIGIESGEWNTPGFRGVGLTQDWVSWARGGATWVERRDLTGTSSPTPGTWYYVLLAVDEDGRFLVHVWERDRPSAASEAQWHLGEDWTGLEWYLWTDTARGKLYLDRYTELSFAQLR